MRSLSLSEQNGVLRPLVEPLGAKTVSGVNVLSNARGVATVRRARDESDDDKTVYLHAFTKMHRRIRQQARKRHQLQSAFYG